MEPRGELSSTGYVLANPGVEYLVLQPSKEAEPFSVELGAGTYAVEWYSVGGRQTRGGGTLTVEGTHVITFSSPLEAAGPVVVYLIALKRGCVTHDIAGENVIPVFLLRPVQRNAR